MGKLYFKAIMLLFLLAAAWTVQAQHAFFGSSEHYGGDELPPRLAFNITHDKQFAEPIPNDPDNWGQYRAMVMLGKDGNVYGLNDTYGSVFYKITPDGLFPVYNFDYAHVGPMAEFDPGTFYLFTSGVADGNYVVIERIKSDGTGYKVHSMYKPYFRPQKLLSSPDAIYGVSNSGGANSGSGFIFKFTPTEDLKNFQVIYDFAGLNGRKPVGRLTEGSDGFLYGVTSTGGANEGGVVYKIRKDGTQFTKLYDFSYNTGRYPSTGLISDGNGWLYGATKQGGPSKKGGVFRIRTDGTGYAMVYNFDPARGGTTGDLTYFNGSVYGYENGVEGAQPVPMRIFQINTSTNFVNPNFFTFPTRFVQGGADLVADPSLFVPNISVTKPVQSQIVYHENVKIAFTPVELATEYTVEVSLDNFATITERIVSSATEVTATKLKAGTKYYVRVRSNLYPAFGPTSTFSTVVSNPAPAYVTNPKDGATGVNAPSTKVTSSIVQGALRYTIELSTTPDFATKFVRTSAVDNQRTMVFDSLKYLTKYYARAKTEHTNYGRITSFTTRAETFAQIIKPATGITDVDPEVVHIQISPVTGAKKYIVQLSENAAFNSPFELRSLNDLQSDFAVQQLKHATTYYVRVKADINTTWGPTSSFSTRESIAAKSLWGITQYGGLYNGGTVFSYDIQSGTFTKHYDYRSESEGESTLQGSLIHGADGRLYFHSGTRGQTSYFGGLYEVTRDGVVNYVDEIALHDGNKTIASDYRLYSTVNSHMTSGVIDWYDINSRKRDNLYVLRGSARGIDPGSELVELDGYLYGRASEGGLNGRGLLYRFRPDGSSYEVFHYFDNNLTGSQPTGDLVMANDGYFYGTTRYGGTFNNGTIFKIKPDGTGFLKLFDLTGNNGYLPEGGVIVDGTTLYGTTPFGGAHGHGTVFRINTNGTGFTILHHFSRTDGETPLRRLTLVNNTLYGLATGGGNHQLGVIYKVNTDGSNFAVLHHLTMSDGAYPDSYLRLKENTFGPTLTQFARADETPIVEVSPNPTTTAFAVKISSGLEQRASVTISDMNGLVVFEGEVAPNDVTRIGETLQRGIYILKARQGDAVTTHRLVKK